MNGGLNKNLFWLAVITLAGFLAAAIPFSDFAVAGSVFFFVPIMIAASGAAWAAADLFSRVNFRHQIQIFWAVTLGLRLIAFFMTPGDDIHRYLWEGHIQSQGFNPYLLAPDSPLLVHLRGDNWRHINHNFWAAIYPPGAELMLKSLTVFGPSVLLMKIVYALADLLTILILTKIAGLKKSAWVAWSPLVIYSFAGAAHFDSVMLLFLMLAVYALVRARPDDKFPADWLWSSVIALSLGASISIKLVPLVLLPVFALALRSRMIVLLLTPVIPLSLATLYGWPQTDIFHTFREFAYVSRFNDFIWWLSEKFFWTNPEQKNGVYSAIAMAAALLVSTLAWRDWRRALLWVMGVVLIFSTVVHPWYVVWILPFAALCNVKEWFVLSSSVFLAFLWWETTPWWTAWTPSLLLSLAISLPLVFATFYRLASVYCHKASRIT